MKIDLPLLTLYFPDGSVPGRYIEQSSPAICLYLQFFKPTRHSSSELHSHLYNCLFNIIHWIGNIKINMSRTKSGFQHSPKLSPSPCAISLSKCHKQVAFLMSSFSHIPFHSPHSVIKSHRLCLHVVLEILPVLGYIQCGPPCVSPTPLESPPTWLLNAFFRVFSPQNSHKYLLNHES